MGCVLVLGGARSGKSTYAELLARRLSDHDGLSVSYLATAEASDEEMATRIRRHQSNRPTDWQTIEESLEVATWIESQTERQVILIDCLSLLLNNWMFLEHCTEDGFFRRMKELVTTIQRSPSTIIVVSNEVGQGIVPVNPLSRQYRDWLGLLNQAVARIASSAILVIAGIPVDLKKLQVEL